MRAGAIVPAAGRGIRMGSVNKAFLPLAGRPVLFWTLERLSAAPELVEIVVVVAPEEVAHTRESLTAAGFTKVAAVVAGGAERQQSVVAGLAALSPEVDTVLVHDGARPLVATETVSEALAVLTGPGGWAGVGVGAPVKDTIKVVGEGGLIRDTPPRQALWAIHTPQVFPREVLARAHAAAADDGVAVTDDCALVERLGLPVGLVPDRGVNLKLTTPEDLAVAEALLALERQEEGSGGQVRVGIGYDVHRLVPDRPLILGGVRIPHPVGLLGHSDADVLAHAIADAVLGALALGDLGKHFPDTDPAYAGADSLELLRQVSELVEEQGWRVANVDAVVVAERPKLAPHVAEMRRRLAGALGCGTEAVSVKATTSERLGFTGREEGVAAQAVCLLASK